MRALLLFLLMVFSVNATTYYASPTGSSSNSGLTQSVPWPLVYALANAGANNTIILLDGNYPDVGGYEITSANQTVRALNKWKARFPNSTYHGMFSSVDGVVIDGIQVTNAAIDGIKVNGSRCTVRNCWVHHGAAQGISSHNPASSNLFEMNLSEYNGSTSLHHGFYVGASGSIIRNNVSRRNAGYGIQVYPEDGFIIWGTQVYNNLVYSNAVAGGSDGGIVCYTSTTSTSSGTNSIYGNTVLQPVSGTSCVFTKYGTSWVTNNILLGATPILKDGVNVLRADYNMTWTSVSTSGPHDVISANAAFVRTNTGLYWIKVTSAARGAALAGVFGVLNFFGSPQSSVSDIGAFQFLAQLTNDTRVLDPSPASGADYWTIPTSGTTPPSISVQPQNATVLTGTPVTFSVTATGTTPLSYQWNFNGSAIGGAFSASYSIASPTPANTGFYSCTVTNIAGSITSFAASLNVTNAPPLPPLGPSNVVIVIKGKNE